jgi:hypothetical protein
LGRENFDLSTNLKQTLEKLQASHKYAASLSKEHTTYKKQQSEFRDLSSPTDLQKHINMLSAEHEF